MSTIRTGPILPSATTLTKGIHGGNIQQVADSVATDVATVSQALSGRQKNVMAEDATLLRRNLLAVLPSGQEQSCMMLAGAWLSGPHGVVVPDLAKVLHDTAHSRPKTAALAEKIAALQADGHGSSARASAVLNSLNSRTLGKLVELEVGADNMHAGMFIAGALVRQFEKHGLPDTGG